MIRIYTRNGQHDVPDTLIKLLGEVVASRATYTDIHAALLPEIDETEAVPVLEDIPEDPEITIERLHAKILELEAELEERRRSTDAILEALKPLGTIVVDQAGVSTPEISAEALVAKCGDFTEPSIPAGVTGPQYFAAKAAYQAKQQAGYHSYNLSAKF